MAFADAPLEFDDQGRIIIDRPINWNKMEDPLDLEVWNKLTQQFWLPEKIALSNDLKSWNSLTHEEQDATSKVFTGLAGLDSIQGHIGAPSLIADARTQHEVAVLNNVAFMEETHAKSYSATNATFLSSEDVEHYWRWFSENDQTQAKLKRIVEFYYGENPLMKKAASTILESFLFYSGFYLPLYWASIGKLTNTADLIRLIIRDECLTKNHDLLTPNGWKPIADITKDDQVAQYNVETEQITFAYPTNVSKHTADHTWEFSNEQGHVRLGTSPRHRMLLERRDYGKGTTYEHEVVEAEDLKQTRLNAYARVLHGALKSGGRDELTAIERLLVAISADGSFDMTTKNQAGELRRTGVKTGTVPVRFSLSKQRKYERLIALAEEADWELIEGPIRHTEGNTKDRRQFRLMVPVEFVDNTKALANIASLDEVSGAWCVQFIDELAEWDGYWVDGGDKRITWGSTSSENADYVQAVAALAGHRAHRTVRPDDRSETFSDYHRVQILKDSPYTSAQRVNKVRAESQEVYGVEVPDSFLLTRNGDSVTITGNSVHGFYIGYKFQQGLKEFSSSEQERIEDETKELLFELYENEITYTEDIYDPLGLTEDVKQFLHYNANKALMNLGFETIFPSDQTQANPAVMSSLTLTSETHDFFSGSGSSYTMGITEEIEDEDWEF